MTGDYFISKDCIGCMACNSTLPDIFGMGDDTAYIIRQPKTLQERIDCADMQESCPSEAIKVELSNEIHKIP